MNLVRWDLYMQKKYGLINAGIIMSILWIAILMLFSSSLIPSVIPLVLLGDLATMGFMFIASMIYFERGQGSVNAVISTPVKTKEYIQSKIFSLFIYILCVSLVVVYSVSIIKGVQVNLIFVLLSITMTSIFYMLLGLFLSTKYKSFTDFLFPTGILFLILFVPILDFLNLEQLKFLDMIYYIWPTHGMLLLMKGMFNPISVFNFVYAVAINLVFIWFLYKKCLKEFNIKIIGRRGDIDG